MARRVDVWIATLPTDTPVDKSDLPALLDTRAANARRLNAFHRMRRGSASPVVHQTWRGLPPAWVTANETDELLRQIASAGILDFRPLDEEAIVTWLRRLDQWSQELPNSLELATLGLTADDLAAQAEEAARARWERAQVSAIGVTGWPASLP